jgi:tRNA A-37 threonylcarbamoyl transferase component Bud32
MIGTKIEHYDIIERLGQGGMGAVYRATDTLLEREVALKLLRPEYAADPLFAERFRAEAVTLAKLSHPNIATLFGFGRDPSQLYMIMELATGETLGNLLKRTGALSWERAILLTGQMLDALQYAHERGVVHRDIKPSNLMVGEDDHLKLMDFGIARLMGTTRVTQMGFTVGTLEYMAPEQIRGEDVDGRADIYATGVVLYEMVTGQLPFKSSREQALMFAHLQQEVVPPRTHRPNLPWHLSDVIVRALAKAPGDRYSSAREFSDALGASASSLSLPTTASVRVPTGHTVSGNAAAPRRRTSPSRAVASAGVAYIGARDDDATTEVPVAQGGKPGFWARWWPQVRVSSNKFGGANEPAVMYQASVGAGGFAGAIRIVAVRMGTAGRVAATRVSQAFVGASHVVTRRPAIVGVIVLLALIAGGWYWRQRRIDPNGPREASVMPAVTTPSRSPAPASASGTPVTSPATSTPSASAAPGTAAGGGVEPSAPTVEPASATIPASGASGVAAAAGASGTSASPSAPASAGPKTPGAATAAGATATREPAVRGGTIAAAHEPAKSASKSAAATEVAAPGSSAVAPHGPAPAAAGSTTATIAAVDKAPLPPPAEPDLKLENEVTLYTPKDGDIEETEGTLTVHGNEITIIDGDDKLVKTIRLRADRPGSGPAASGPARIFSHRRTRWLVLPIGAADQFVVQVDRDDLPKLIATLEARIGRPVTMVDGEPQFPKTK